MRGFASDRRGTGGDRPGEAEQRVRHQLLLLRTTGGAIEVEGKENDTADTARAATGAAMELAITGRAFEATTVGVTWRPSGVSICMAS